MDAVNANIEEAGYEASKFGQNRGSDHVKEKSHPWLGARFTSST